MRNLGARYKETGGIAVAAGILAAIFIPFQKAEAFTAELGLPDDNPDNVPQSAAGSAFLITIDISPGELVSLSQIEIILDNGTPEVKRAIFGASDAFVSGDSDITVGNLVVTVPSATTSGYGYGYGIVSHGTAFSAPYSYSFSSSQDFLSGNSYNYSYAVPSANLVNGFVGPATITIEGKLNTADMSLGSHTLDVLVHTGAGGNGVDKIVPPQLAFTVTQAPPPANVPPTANAGPDQTVNEGASVTLDGTASSDSDGTVASYAWTQTAGPAVTLAGANTVHPTFTAPEVSSDTVLTFKLIVTDDDGAHSAPDTVNVTVKNVPPTPTGAADLIRALIAKAEGMGANANMLKQAPKLLEDGNPHNDVAACGKLGAFVNHTNAQAGKSLTHEQADELIGDARHIEDLLGCGGHSSSANTGDDSNDDNTNSSNTHDDNSSHGKEKGNKGNGDDGDDDHGNGKGHNSDKGNNGKAKGKNK